MADDPHIPTTKVTVIVPKPPPAPRPGQARHDTVYYGPFSRPSDDDLGGVSGPIEVAVVDLSTNFIQELRGSGGQRYLLFFAQRDPALLSGFPLWASLDGTDLDAINNYLIGASTSPTSQSVIKIGSGVYRTSFNAWPMPHDNGDPFGLSLRLNSVDYALNAADDKWVELVITIPEEIAEQAADFSILILSGTTSSQNFWPDTFQAWIKNYAELKPQKKTKTYRWRLDAGGGFYEPFDPFDIVNYKVTNGAYSDPEVVPLILGSRSINPVKVQVGITPKRWDVTASYVDWQVDESSVPFNIYKRTRTVQAFIIGFSCPFIMTSNSAEDTILLPLNSSSFDRRPIPVNGIFQTPFGSTSVVTATMDGTPQAVFSGPTDFSDPNMNMLARLVAFRMGATGGVNRIVSGEFPDGLIDFGSTNATLTIVTAALPAGSLVGKLTAQGKTYHVYRRTPTAGGDVVYDGPYDGLEGQVDPSAPNNSGYKDTTPLSVARDFSDWDPGSLYTHTTI